MSEYQYYEFAAVDRPLSEKDMRALRAISTRAEITPRGFVNHYEWGDFKGDPARLMEKYFDLFLYLTNWGSRRVSIRFPARLVDAAELRRFCVDDAVAMVRVVDSHIILDIERDEVDEDDWFDGRGQLAALAPLRTDILNGDLHALYLVWLMAVENGNVSPEAVEPLSGIARLSTSLEAFADFFAIDGDLVDAAVNRDGAAHSADSAPDAAEAFIRSLPDEEKVAMLLRLYDGSDPHLGIELRRRRREAAGRSAESGVRLRTAEELLAMAGGMREERRRVAEQKATAERRREERRLAEEKKRHLARIAQRGETAWREVEELIVMRNPSGYDRAVRLLMDLAEIARSESREEDFGRHVADIRQRHERKGQFLTRLDTAGIRSKDVA